MICSARRNASAMCTLKVWPQWMVANLLALTLITAIPLHLRTFALMRKSSARCISAVLVAASQWRLVHVQAREIIWWGVEPHLAVIWRTTLHSLTPRFSTSLTYSVRSILLTHSLALPVYILFDPCWYAAMDYQYYILMQPGHYKFYLHDDYPRCALWGMVWR